MKKTKIYENVIFKADIVKSALDKFIPNRNPEDKLMAYYILKRGSETWEFDLEHEKEFFADYRKDHSESDIRITSIDWIRDINIWLYNDSYVQTKVYVKASTRGEIEEIFEIFESQYERSIIKVADEIVIKEAPTIFIGHGRSPLWKDLKLHLSDQHGYKIEAYESASRVGQSITSVLYDMSRVSSFALLVLTGEDKDDEGNIKARQNVIHELGLFQGKLGFNRALVLMEEGTEEFSNIHGLQQLRFSKGNIKEIYGEVLAALKREFA